MAKQLTIELNDVLYDKCSEYKMNKLPRTEYKTLLNGLVNSVVSSDEDSDFHYNLNDEIELLRAKIKNINELLHSHEEKIRTFDETFNSVTNEFANVNARIDKLDELRAMIEEKEKENEKN